MSNRIYSVKRKYMVKAYLSEEEYNQIVKTCKLTRLSISAFVRKVCTGSKVESREDAMARIELYKINANLGRLGGLLKLALAGNICTQEIRVLLMEIKTRQRELKEKVMQI